MTTLWVVQTFGIITPVVDTLWFALIGSAITVAVGTTSAALRGSRGGPGGMRPVGQVVGVSDER